MSLLYNTTYHVILFAYVSGEIKRGAKRDGRQFQSTPLTTATDLTLKMSDHIELWIIGHAY